MTRSQLILRATVLTILILLILLVLVIIDIRRDSIARNAFASVAVNDAIIDITSPYFAFKAPNGWRLDEASSNETQYIYKKYRGNSYQAVFTVLIDPKIIPELRRAQYVYPMQQDPESLAISTKKLSPMCSSMKDVPTKQTENINVIMYTYEQASFPCWTDTSRAIVVAAQVEGTDLMTFKRPDGSSRVYWVSYEDVNNASLQGGLELLFDNFRVR